MKTIGIIGAALAYSLGSMEGNAIRAAEDYPMQRKLRRPLRPCPQCGKQHDNKGAFCSLEHYRAHKEGEK